MLASKTSGLVSEKAAVDLQAVLKEASEWIEAVTGKRVEPSSFRAELENGIILCELIERILPGSIKRINRMNIAMAHLDNLKQFLNACEKFGLKDSQLFDVTDLQLPNTMRLKSGGIKHTTADRRLRNVCITIYWLGRILAQTPGYNGPRLNLEAFREILDIPVTSSNFFLQGYETPDSTANNHKKTTPIPSYTKQPIVTTTLEIDLEPQSPPQLVEIKGDSKSPETGIPRENGMVTRDEDLTPDELLANIQSAVDELLLDYKPSPEPPVTSTKNGIKKREQDLRSDLIQRVEDRERSHSSPSPTTFSSPSPTPQPLPQFFNIKIDCGVGGTLGLQLIGGADTAIPAQVEVVMPGKPADQGGLKAEDIIISVDQQDVTRMAHHELIDFIKQCVGRGGLTLGVERSVQQQPAQVMQHKIESRTLWEEEQAERERQKREIAIMYNKKQPLATSNGHSHDQLKPKEAQSNEREEEKEKEEERREELSDEELDIELRLQSHPRTSTHQTTFEEPEESVSRLEEELEALNSYIIKRHTPSHDVSGIGQILPNTVSGKAEPQEYPEEEGEKDEPESEPENECDEEEEDRNGDENEEENGNEDENMNEDDSSFIVERVEEKFNRPEADGKEENVTMVTPNHSPVRTDVDEVDPFAPISLRPSNSSHLLSDVLSVHKPTIVSTMTQTPPRSLPTPTNTASRPPVSYQVAPSQPPTSYKTTPSAISPASFTSRPHTSMPSQTRRTTPSEPKKPATAFEVQDEIQEMHGIKVRPVQRTRWTPETNRDRKTSVEQKHLENKSSIYERREVVMMEARGRAQSYASHQHSNFNKQGNRRPWSGQPKKEHHFCAHCRGPIFQGPLLAIPDKDLYFHSKCLVCVVCRSPMTMVYGRTTVFLRHSLPHCTSCYSNDNGIKVTTC